MVLLSPSLSLYLVYSTPDRPLHEIISSIRSEDMADSLPSPLSPLTSLTRSQSDSDSLPSYTHARFGSASGVGELEGSNNSFTDSLPTHLSPPGVAGTIVTPASDGGVGLDDNVQNFARASLENTVPKNGSDDTQKGDITQISSDIPSVPSSSVVSPLGSIHSEAILTTVKKSPEISGVKSASPSKSPSLKSSKGSTPRDTVSPLDNASKHLSPQEALSPVRNMDTLSPPGERNNPASSQRKVEGGEERNKVPSHSVVTSEEVIPTTSTTTASNASKNSSTSKPSSNNSSRVGSGRNTPRSQRSLGNSASFQTGKEGSSRHSPVPQGTPPLAVARKPPHDFPEEYIKRKLESLVPSSGAELSLPSPLYSQEEEVKGPGSGAGGKGGGIDQEDSGNMNTSSIYDRQDSAEKTDVIESAVTLSNPDATGSRVGKRRERRNAPAKAVPKVIVCKPGLESNNVRMFFKKIIADDTSEILMNVTWGIANLPCVPSCELEVGAIISDRGVYLLEVLDPEQHLSRPLSWTTENLPLAKIMCCYHTTIRKINIGIFDQSLTMEACGMGAKKTFVFFPHTYEKLNLFVENLKAAFDASGLPFTVASSIKDSFVSMSGKEEMVIHNPDSSDMAALKESLVWARSRAQVGNFIAVNSKSETIPLTISFDAELKRVSWASASKFEIVQYVIVGEVTADVLPISNGMLHVCSRALILTNKMIYLCKEELDSWPHKSKSIRPPPFPKCMVIDAHPISRITGIKVCDKSRPVISCSDPLYEFSISFEELDDIKLSPTLVREWVLCAHDRQYLDQLLGCLTHLSNELQKENQKLVSIKHVASKLPTPSSPKMPKTFQTELHVDHRKTRSVGEVGSKKKFICSNRGANPCFFSSRGLLEFSLCTNYQRLKFFKKHVAQAEFMKSDEIPLSVFLAHCSSSITDYVEIETCIIVSNYALYLLSDVDSIAQWVESGGLFSFQRRDLLNRTNSDQIRCFYRLWLNEMRQLSVGLYYTSLSITDVKHPDSPRLVVHTENPSATLSFLNAVSCVVDLHDTDEEKEMSYLLSDYDLMDDSVDIETGKKKQADRSAKIVEFVYKSEDNLYKLKKAMVGVSPAITKGMSVDTCNATIKILYQQVILLVEELRIRDHLSSCFYPHFVFLTNYGVYVCLSEASEKCSPSVLDPGKLSVKKWCHIDLLERLQVFSPSTKQYSCYNVVVHLRSVSRASFSSGESNSLSFLIQNSELLNCFIYHFSLMYHERCGKQIAITRE